MKQEVWKKRTQLSHCTFVLWQRKIQRLVKLNLDDAQYCFKIHRTQTGGFLITELRVSVSCWNYSGKYYNQNEGSTSPVRPPVHEISQIIDQKLLFLAKFVHFWPIIDQILLTDWAESVNGLLKLFREVFWSKRGVYQPSTTSRSQYIYIT